MKRILLSIALLLPLLTLDQINTLRKLQALPVITTNQFLAALTNTVRSDNR